MRSVVFLFSVWSRMMRYDTVQGSERTRSVCDSDLTGRNVLDYVSAQERKRVRNRREKKGGAAVLKFLTFLWTFSACRAPSSKLSHCIIFIMRGAILCTVCIAPANILHDEEDVSIHTRPICIVIVLIKDVVLYSYWRNAGLFLVCLMRSKVRMN